MVKKYEETLHYLETRIASAFEHAKRAKEKWQDDEDGDHDDDDPHPTDKWLNHWRALCRELDDRVTAGEQDVIHPVFEADDMYGWYQRDEFKADIHLCHHPVFVEMVDEEGNVIPGTKQVIALVREFSVGRRLAQMLNSNDYPPNQSMGDLR